MTKEELFLSLINGIDKKEIPKKFKNEIEILEKHKFIKLCKNIYKFDKKFLFGKIDINSKGIGFFTPFKESKNRDLLIESNNLKGAIRGDLVLVKRLKSVRRASAEVVYIAIREKNLILVYLKKTKSNQILGFELKTDIQINLKVSQKSLRQLPSYTVLKIDSLTSKVIEVLGVLTDSQIDEKISLALYSRPNEFSKLSNQEGKSFGDEVDILMYPNREDLTPYPFCTIDPNDAKDFDDAIYYDSQEKILYVAVADVSEYVSLFSNINKEAKERGFSIYFPHKSIPMLPRILSENICSLKENKDRLAFTFKIYLDNNFNIKSYQLLNSVIHSHKSFTYDEIDLALENNINLNQFNWIKELQKVTTIWKKERLKKGFDFLSNDIRIELNKNGNLINSKIEKNTISHSIIEESMLICNRLASKMLDFGIFRNHEEPSLNSIQELKNNLTEIGIFDNSENIKEFIKNIQIEAENIGLRDIVDKMIIKSLKQARYSSINNGHFGLGFDKYTHFTSPIRRYSDLILHRILKAKLKNNKKEFNFILQHIEIDSIKLSELERETNRVMWDFTDRKFARWSFNNIGETLTVTIIEHGKNDLIAKVLNGIIQSARIFIKTNKKIPLFTQILIQIDSVNLANGKIYGKIKE